VKYLFYFFLGRTPHETPQHLVDKSVIHTEDDKYMIYEIEELAQEDHKVCFPLS
jgi:hypothetical protein